MKRRLNTGILFQLKQFFREQSSIFQGEPLSVIGLIIVCGFILLAIFGPFIAPYGPFEATVDEYGLVPKDKMPSPEHWLGLTRFGYDVFSQTVLSARTAIVVGLISALMVVFVGANLGLLSGYFGGWLDEAIMRLTDIAYGIPFLPLAIVLMTLLGKGVHNIIIVIVILFWRTTTRVIRAQVLSIKERPFIQAAHVAGASHLRIIYVHIAPNVLPMTFLYIALAVGWAVLAEASISFLGFGDPNAVSWGQMVHHVFAGQMFRTAWWWYLPPGICIILLVMGTFWIGLAYEKVVNPRLKID
ncbi:MAG: ABC transporter permease [Desulfohalobiaceae bacterium]|nr:ABC transporter permease [Desulfohalobiaceae bacterium]